MKKSFLFVLVFSLLLAFGRIASAADLHLSLGIEYQSGSYDWDGSAPDDTPIYDATTDVPTWRLSIAGDWGKWYGAAFYAAGEGGGSHSLITVDDPGESPWGGASSYGADLGYTFEFGGLTVRPLLGYRELMFAAGVEISSPPAIQQIGFGLKVKGIRLGAEAVRSFGEAWAVRAGLGFLIDPAIREFQEMHADDGIVVQDVYVVLSNPSADCTCLDASLAVDYAFNESLKFTLGYRYIRGSLELTSSPVLFAPKTEFSSGVFSLGAAYSF